MKPIEGISHRPVQIIDFNVGLCTKLSRCTILFTRLCSAHMKVSLISNEGASLRGVILNISVKRKTEFSQEICGINKVDFSAPAFIKFYNLVCARPSLGICTVICR